MRLVVVAGIALAGVLSFAAADSDPSAAVAPSTAAPRAADAKDLRIEVAGAAPLACSTSLAAITPCTQSATALTNRVKTTQFTVQNKNTIEPVSFILTCARTGAVTTCSAPGSLYVPKNSSKTVST